MIPSVRLHFRIQDLIDRAAISSQIIDRDTAGLLEGDHGFYNSGENHLPEGYTTEETNSNLNVNYTALSPPEPVEAEYYKHGHELLKYMDAHYSGLIKDPVTSSNIFDEQQMSEIDGDLDVTRILDTIKLFKLTRGNLDDSLNLVQGQEQIPSLADFNDLKINFMKYANTLSMSESEANEAFDAYVFVHINREDPKQLSGDSFIPQTQRHPTQLPISSNPISFENTSKQLEFTNDLLKLETDKTLIRVFGIHERIKYEGPAIKDGESKFDEADRLKLYTFFAEYHLLRGAAEVDLPDMFENYLESKSINIPIEGEDDKLPCIEEPSDDYSFKDYKQDVKEEFGIDLGMRTSLKPGDVLIGQRGGIVGSIKRYFKKPQLAKKVLSFEDMSQTHDRAKGAWPLLVKYYKDVADQKTRNAIIESDAGSTKMMSRTERILAKTKTDEDKRLLKVDEMFRVQDLLIDLAEIGYSSRVEEAIKTCRGSTGVDITLDLLVSPENSVSLYTTRLKLAYTPGSSMGSRILKDIRWRVRGNKQRMNHGIDDIENRFGGIRVEKAKSAEKLIKSKSKK